MMSRLYTNTGKLARFILRRNRIRIPVWIVSIVSFTIMIGAMLPELYPTSIERQMMAETLKNPAVTFMVGPGYGLDNYTDGAMMAHYMLAFTAVTVGIMNILLTARHTREDEEYGRIEMIRSLPAGPLSPLTAAFLILIITNVIIFLTVAFGLYSLGFESIDLGGSLLYGASLGAIGIFFSALTGFFAQLTTNNRSTIGYSFGFLIIAYIARGIGDVENEILSLISPLGLILRTQVYVNNYWWPVLVTVGVSVVLFGLALYLNSVRDLGSGFIPTKPGRSKGSVFLSSPLGLSLRLQRTPIIAWVIGMFILGVSYGSVAGDLEGFVESSELIQQMLPNMKDFNLTDNYTAMLMTVLSIMGTIPVLMYILKLKFEEKRGRTEHLFSAAVSRNNVIGSYTLTAIVYAVVIQLMSILGFWSAAVFAMDDAISLNTLLKAGFVHLPAIWVMVGLAVLLTGIFPEMTGLTWLYLGFSFFVMYLGDLIKLPDWMAKLTPFGYTPQVPIEDISFPVLTVLTIIAAGLIIIGFIGYNKRDIQG
ncbi:MAG: ABC transporter permease [Clostridiaceae bacterium]|nr:ABC transporter permease [Clostridiaceae bacterium]